MYAIYYREVYCVTDFGIELINIPNVVLTYIIIIIIIFGENIM